MYITDLRSPYGARSTCCLVRMPCGVDCIQTEGQSVSMEIDEEPLVIQRGLNTLLRLGQGRLLDADTLSIL